MEDKNRPASIDGKMPIGFSGAPCWRLHHRRGQSKIISQGYAQSDGMTSMEKLSEWYLIQMPRFVPRQAQSDSWAIAIARLRRVCLPYSKKVIEGVDKMFL
jgi:hypothetical protein